MGRSFDDIVADNCVAARTYAFRCLVEFRLLAGPEGEVRFGWSDGGQGAWCVVRPALGLTRQQRQTLHLWGWKYARFNTGANYDGGFHRGWRGWSKHGNEFHAEAVTTDEEAAKWFEDRAEQAYYESQA